jgi:SAM-dependent methyltransferase
MKHDNSTTLSSRGSVQRLALKDFARLFGTSTSDLPEVCVRLIEKANFAYRELEGRERDKVILSVIKRITSEKLTVAGDEGARARWEKGWSENLQNLAGRNFEPSALVPKYIRPNQAVRLNQNYVVPQDGRFEFNWYRVFTYWLFQKYLGEADVIYEFGCGSGINVAILAKMFPEKKIVGLDWAPASKKILDKLANVHRWDVEGRLFDFFKPDDGGVKLMENSAVLTIGALEQTGRRYGAFLNYLLKASPSICVNIEPVREWYDENNLVDYLAIIFHKRRGYWEGFPARLKELEAKGKVELLKMKRSYFGSLFIEGYSQSIWKPSGGRS